MALAAGVRLGPYEIVALVGAGGMGEVYKARDTRLDRPVAIKLLPTELAERPDRRARFEAEARAISALSHPHICTLFDVGDAVVADRDSSEPNRLQFLVMEYLEGETLDDRLRRGPLPAKEVLRFAIEIADALDHAHRERIVHRDLKPSNVMLTASGVKLLDFGLAKDVTAKPTASMATISYEHRKLTAEGTIIGTFQYMAPEQLEGKPADPRTDTFAFGTVLYEMATGRKAFEGESQASLIASILTGQTPSIAATSPGNGSGAAGAFAALDHIVERCLAKQPDERWQTARDVKLELEWIARGGSALTPRSTRRTIRRREAVAWTLAIAAVAAAGTLAAVGLRRTPKEISRFIVEPPAGLEIGVPENRTRLAVSPDGRKLVFAASTGGNQQLWVRALDSSTPEPLAGTEGAASPFWSPDSRFIGFFSASDGELRKVDAAGGAARTIAAASMEGAPVWGADNSILFTQYRDGIFRVSAEGGTPMRVTALDKTKGELNHYWPTFLPDGRHFLYMATALRPDGLRATPSVYVASFDSPDVKLLARMHSRMTYAPPGHLLFVEDGVLFARAFDTANLRLTGEPIQIADTLGYVRTLGNGAFAVSDNGVLAYLGSDDAGSLVWHDRLGRVTDPAWGTQNFGTIRFSPDAQRIAAEVVDPRTGAADIWIYDVARGVPVRFTTDVTNQSHPVWSPDGGRVLFRWERSGSPKLYARAIGTGADELVVADPTPLTPEDWSADGRWIAYHKNTRQTGKDLWLMPMTGDRTPRPFSDTRFEESSARFSPDSRLIAFVSTESGPPEVYVAPVLEPGNRKRLSIGGGTAPLWRGDGRELFYTALDNRAVMSVPIEPGPSIKAGLPTRLFSVNPFIGRDRARNVAYDVSPDGQRFLIGVPASEPATSRITVVLNWQAALTR